MDITIEKQENNVVVEICDYGIGIKDEIMQKIFDKGFKFGENANTGLGLYIVKESLKNYDGQIIVDKHKSGGAKFIINLQRVN